MKSKKASNLSLLKDALIMLIIVGILLFLYQTYIADNTTRGINDIIGISDSFEDGDTIKGSADLCPCEPSSGYTAYKLNPSVVEELGLFKEGTTALLASDEYKIELYLDSWHQAGVDSLPIGYLDDFAEENPPLNVFCKTPAQGDTCTINDFRNTYYEGGAKAVANTCYFSPNECEKIKKEYDSFAQVQEEYSRT